MPCPTPAHLDRPRRARLPLALLALACLLGLSPPVDAQPGEFTTELDFESTDGLVPPNYLELRTPVRAPPLVDPNPWPDLEALLARMEAVAAALDATPSDPPVALLLEEADLHWWAAEWIADGAAAEADATVAAERAARATALQDEAGRLYARMRTRFDAPGADRARATYMAGLIASRDELTPDGTQLLRQTVLADPGSEAAHRAAMVLGDHYFRRSELDLAVEFLGFARESSDPRVADYARYERAWSLFNLERYEEALHELGPLTLRECETEAYCLTEIARADLINFLDGAADSPQEVEAYCASGTMACPPDVYDLIIRYFGPE